MKSLKKYLVATLLFFSATASAQNKAILLQNVWANSLNSYDPNEFFNNLFSVIKDKMGVAQLTADPLFVNDTSHAATLQEKVQGYLQRNKVRRDSAYFICIAGELKLPTINIGKLLFKKATQQSKFIFFIQVYDGTGTPVISDTVVNRGCIVKNIDSTTRNKYFYPDYKTFMNDMRCHLEVIRKQLQQRPIVNRKSYLKSI